jgi:hypothetical protein
VEFGIPLIRGVPKVTQGGIRYSSDQRRAKIHLKLTPLHRDLWCSEKDDVLARMPLMFPNLASCRVVMALASTFFLQLPDNPDAKDESAAKPPVMTFFTPEYLRELRGEHKERGNLLHILGCGFMANAVISQPNSLYFQTDFEDAQILNVGPRLEYIQHYQAVHHTFVSEKQLMPGFDTPVTST